MTEYTIFHLDVNGAVIKTLGKFEDGFTLNASSLHPTYEEDYVYCHSLENPWISSGVYGDVDDFDGNYEECGEFTSSEDEFAIDGIEKSNPLKGYFLVLHSYNDRALKPRNLPHFRHKVLNGALKEIFPQSVYYGNVAIVKTNLKDNYAENIEIGWSEMCDLIRNGNWILDIDGHLVHAREYKILGRRIRASEILESCRLDPEIEDDNRDPRDIYDYISREIHLRDVRSSRYDIYGNIDELYLGIRLDKELSKELYRVGFEERRLEEWLRKLTGKGDYEVLTIVSWLN